MTRVHELAKLGQSIWIDYIRRSFLVTGEFQKVIDEGVTGVTSNPAIFAAAIADSDDYDETLTVLANQDLTTAAIYEALAVEDIQMAADLLRPIYENTAGVDGYVSLEVSPDLAHDTDRTVEEARHLFATVDRPNVLIKVPATKAGIPAIETLIGEGINVNITLMFSLAHYEAVTNAYIRGLEALAARGGDLSRVASVASFFLSRIDSKIDPQLDGIGSAQALALRGKIAIANAKVTYARFRDIFSGPQWESLASQGAKVQRVLWASTSTKNPAYPDTMYVDELIGPDTVNTIPPETLEAFLDHGRPALTVTKDLFQAKAELAALADLGIDLSTVTEELQEEGVEKFAKPFHSLLESLAAKATRLRNKKALFETSLGSYQVEINDALTEIESDQIVNRIWEYDYTVWAPEPEEIVNRLGWLHCPENMPAEIGRIQALVDDVRAAGYTNVLLLGMGGSSLAPEVFSNIFSRDHGGLRLAVLDSTDPGAILAYDTALDPAKTLFVVSTKSGGTVETLSFFKYFYNRTMERVGLTDTGEHFVAITDAGSKLHKLAEEYRFRATFLNDPNIGGRYSALSHFGLVPAGLVGVDLALLLERAQEMAENNRDSGGSTGNNNLGARLGATLGELAKQERDKITFLTSPGLANFADWVEQLIAESTGKDGKGIVPVVGEAIGSPQVYGADRLFVYLRLDGDDTYDAAVEALIESGQPAITLHLKDRYDIGGQFFLWEMATAIAGYRLNIQPFNQPNVEAAKVLARQMVKAYEEQGALPPLDIEPLTTQALVEFLEGGEPGDYISLQAYVQPTVVTTTNLQMLQHRLRDRTHLATTFGFGPRFLHSTGQLHKGDAGNGLFIQFISTTEKDVEIPDQAGRIGSSISFGVLKMAQALGDAAALRDAGRRVIQFRLEGAVATAFAGLVDTLSLEEQQVSK